MKRWGALSIGISVEHTHYYDGIFGPTTNMANDVNLFAGYIWRPNPDLKITPAATVTVRLDDGSRCSVTPTAPGSRSSSGSPAPGGPS